MCFLETERLYCRAWKEEDFEAYCRLNQNEEVMRFFPSVYSKEQTRDSMQRMIANFERKNYAYLPCIEKETELFIGWVGMMDQEMAGQQFVDIGWRLDPRFWGKGYASEMAKRFIEFGFDRLQLDAIYAIAPSINKPSIGVMKKIGMTLHQSFKHPLLKESPNLENCVQYVIRNPAK